MIKIVLWNKVFLLLQNYLICLGVISLVWLSLFLLKEVWLSFAYFLRLGFRWTDKSTSSSCSLGLKCEFTYIVSVSSLWFGSSLICVFVSENSVPFVFLDFSLDRNSGAYDEVISGLGLCSSISFVISLFIFLRLTPLKLCLWYLFFANFYRKTSILSKAGCCLSLSWSSYGSMAF